MSNTNGLNPVFRLIRDSLDLIERHTGGLPVGYKVEGTETMGNGSAGTTGHAAVMLEALPWPGRTLTVSELFPYIQENP